MGYILDDTGNMLVKLTKNFMENEVAPYVAELDKNHEFPLDLYKKAFDIGLHTIEIPTEFGGSGLPYTTVCAILEEIGKVDAGFAVTMMSLSLALKPILLFGSKEQKQWAAEKIIPNGGFAAFALTEPDAGSDAGAVKTTAVKDGDEYILNGSKCFITSSSYADIYTVFASVDLSKGLKGLSAFIVEKGTPGLTLGKPEDKMGIRLSNTCSITLDDVRVPAKNLIGKEGQGFKIAMETLNLARPLTAAVAVAIGQRAIEEAISYAKQRIAFGKPIIKNQAIAFKLADMETRVQTARSMVAHSMELYQRHDPYIKEAAIAKNYAGEIAVANALDAIQILGGYGYTADYPVEKLLRDAKIFEIFEGTSEIQRITIADRMIKEYK